MISALRWFHIVLLSRALLAQTVAGICARELTQAEGNMINHGIMLSVSTENFTHNRLLRADNAFLTFNFLPF